MSKHAPDKPSRCPRVCSRLAGLGMTGKQSAACVRHAHLTASDVCHSCPVYKASCTAACCNCHHCPLLLTCTCTAFQDDLPRAESCVCTVQGIRVNGVNPATVNTNFHTAAGMSEEAKNKYYDAGKKITCDPLPCTHTTACCNSLSWEGT